MGTAKTLLLEKLITMKLTSYRSKDQVHVQDMIALGIIDDSWLDRISPVLRDRLLAFLNDPAG